VKKESHTAHDIYPLADAIFMASTYVEPTVPKAGHSSVRVLLVEDDPDSAELTYSKVRSSRHSPFRVEWSDTLRKAMSRLEQPGIDVVLLDLGMPELNGYKTHSTTTCVVGKTISVVILTSDDSDISRELTLESGAASYLVKSQISSSELRQALHEAVASSSRPLPRMTG